MRITYLAELLCRDCDARIEVRIVVGSHPGALVAFCTPCLDARIEAIRAERRSGHYGSVYRPRRKENVA